MHCEECCICLELLKEDIKILECGHKIHNKCSIKLENSNCPSKYKCPICREKILINDMDDYKDNGWRERINPNSESVNFNRENNNIPLPIVQLFMFMNPFDNI